MEQLRIKGTTDSLYSFKGTSDIFVEISSNDGDFVGSMYISKQQATELANWLLEAAK